MTSEAAPEFVERILDDAVARHASDIYFLPRADRLEVRYRVDGVQCDVESVPEEFGRQCVTRLKVLADLLTYRTLVSQDGVITRQSASGKVEMRVAVIPTRHGERITVRVLQKATGPLHLEDLQFPPEAVAALRSMLCRPMGMIVLTGPTGCGKTTTIYALVRELLRERQDPASIITLEDPIESEIEGVSQIHVRETDRWGYAEALRASLRQDVKTLVVGEMRDAEVVRVTLDAALTGHRIVTTYHAGDIASVYSRMLHQGFEPFLVASAITGVVSQRLAARSGGAGRVPVVAVLEPTDEWRDFIIRNPGLSQLRRKLREIPAADLEAAARRLVAAGTIDEKALRGI
jgi:type II secretory ATPase GspE/PulE/Tfp pilus assembly ATPase PilB-like protein